MFRRRRRSKPQSPGSHRVDPGWEISVLPSETAARQAAAGGSPVDMNRLGIILKMKGQEDEAATWFRKAAEMGNKDAIANLALYLAGQGRTKEAAEWFRRTGDELGEALAEGFLNKDRPHGDERRGEAH